MTATALSQFRPKFGDFRDAPALVSRPNGADGGRSATLHIAREGTGRLCYSTRLAYSPTDQAAKETNDGIEVHREYSVKRDGRWQLLVSPLKVTRGELVLRPGRVWQGLPAHLSVGHE